MHVNEADPAQPQAAATSGGSRTALLRAEPGGTVQELDQGQLLASIAATSSDCILSLDVEGTILWASPATLGVLGWRPEDLAGSGISLVTPRSGGDLNAAYLSRLIAGERVAPFVDTGVRRDGSSFKAAVTLGPVHSATGEVTGVTVILRDVTAELVEQRRMEQAVELSHARFEQVITPQALLTPTGRLESVNPAWCDLFAHPADFFVGCDLLSLVHPMDVGNASEQLASLRRGEVDSISYQGIFVDAGGRSLSLLIDATSLREPDGTPYAVAVSARDVGVVDAARRALAVQANLYEALGRRSWDAAVVVDADIAITYGTPSVARLLGYELEDVVSHWGWEYVHPADVPLVEKAIGRLLVRPRGSERLVGRLRDKQGRWRWIEATISNCLDDPDIRGLVANLRDVTEQVQTEEALRLSEALHRAMVETAQEGILATAPDGTTLFANETLAQVLGVPLEDLYGAGAVALLGPDGERHATLPGEPGRFEVTYRHPDGTELTLEVSRSELNAPGPEPMGSLLMVSDVTEARRAERVLRRQALHDPLTGLPNRYLFLDRLETAAARQERAPGSSTAVMFLDLDGFKPINDGHGHVAGDDLLREVADRLALAVRATDTVGRFGGDEFAIICEDTDEEAAALVATRIQESFLTPVHVAGTDHLVRLSIGVAMSPPLDFTELVRRADRAMYRAKELGGGRVELARLEAQGLGEVEPEPRPTS